MDDKEPWKDKDIFAVFVIGLIIGIVIGIWLPDAWLNSRLF